MVEQQKKTGAAMLGKVILVALNEKRLGKADKFNMLLNSLQQNKNAGNVVTIKKRWVVALTSVVAAFNAHELQPILEILMNVNLAKQNYSFICSFTEFLENLVSSHSKIIPMVYATIANGFKRKDVISGAGTSCEGQRCLDELHDCLHRILDFVPSSTSILVQILTDKMPYVDESVFLHEVYVNQLVRIMSYAPALVEPLLELIMEKMLLFDVEVTIDMDGLDEEDEELYESLRIGSNGKYTTKTDGLNALDTNDDSEDTDSEVDDTESCSSEEFGASDRKESKLKLLKRIKEALGKLDKLIGILFKFIDTLKEEGDDEMLQVVFLCLLQIFDRSVVRTHKAKYVPIVLFYMTTLNNSFAEAFVSLLLSRIFDGSCSEYLGITAAGYLGSFLSRAKHVSIDFVSSTLKICSEWLHSYLDYLEDETKSRAFTWFAVVQSVLYVFCFRWREMAGKQVDSFDFQKSQSDQLMDWWSVRGGFQRLIYSQMNPLRVCAPAISSEFDNISKQMELAFCTSIIGTNEQMKAKFIAKDEKDVHMEQMIESFFPFDPYFNRLSVKSKIEVNYISFKSCRQETE
ncbi:hypothetical protein MP638_000161 [Amoeboaphelidium occidentale]|nr:hypothetical protein MP638_000161 [Amoeboaphelidium occidentale]